MTTLQSRLQDGLIGQDDKDFPENADKYWTYPKIRSRLRDTQREKLPELAATIASDLKGMLPPEKEYKKLEPCWYCQGYQYSCCCGDAYNQALTDVLAALDRYCGLTKEEG